MTVYDIFIHEARMKRYIFTIISAVIVVCGLSAAAYAGSSMQDEYLASADRLRVRAAVETDETRKEELLRQADRYEQMADALEPIDIEDNPQDKDELDPQAEQDVNEDEDSIGRQDRSVRDEEKIKRDYERTRKVQDEIDKLTCVSCRDQGSDKTLGE